ncbi:MAG: ferredoxin [Candidatus Brocadiales bacterium]|nr:ferredoxin [Candidatus Brocadiales bacterium]
MVIFKREMVGRMIKDICFEGNCIRCSMCVEESPGVFDFTAEAGPQVKDGIDTALYAESIRRAAYICPTQYIKYRL